MTRRALLGLLAGLLLSVPLIIIAAYAAWEGLRLPVEEAIPVSPVLSMEERLRLATYQRECGKGKECEPPLGCLPIPALFKSHCTDSECVSDTQCREGFSCQVLRTVKGPRVRACLPVGIRQEGQRCVSIPSDKEEACGPGLLCGADWCGRPCKGAALGDCPEGFFCADVSPGPLCLPTCAERSCPDGQGCVSFNRGASVCAVVHGVNCRQSDCPSGKECVVLQKEERPGEAWMECAQPCGEGRPSCPEGRICHRTYCQRPCNPEETDTCGPGYVCGRFRADEPWVCRFDRRRTATESEGP